MDTDKRMGSGNLPNDVMLSSAEDLNNDGSFMGAGGDSLDKMDWEDERLDQAVAELMASEEPEDAQIDPEEPADIAAPRAYPTPAPRTDYTERRHYGHLDGVRAEQAPSRGESPMGPGRCDCRPMGGELQPPLSRAQATMSEEKPIVMMPSAEPAKTSTHEKHICDPVEPAYGGRSCGLTQSACERRSCGPMGERAEDLAPIVRESAQGGSTQRVGVNKAALIWMIILTIVLGGVIGIMIYAFVLDRIDTARTPEPDPDSSLQENLNAVAGALEVYLTDVNLDNYNTDIVLVNGGGMVSIKGTLRHSVFINTTSDLTLVLNGVTIESEKGAAIVNLSSNALNLRVDGMNTLLADGGSYGAALYSNGSLTIRGDGQVMIYAGGANNKAITTKNGYLIDSGAVIALGRAEIERPLDDSTQAYFAKDLTQLYKKGTLVSASNESGAQVVQFTAPGDFSSIFVSNSKLADGVQYSISLGSGGAS